MQRKITQSDSPRFLYPPLSFDGKFKYPKISRQKTQVTKRIVMKSIFPVKTIHQRDRIKENEILNGNNWALTILGLILKVTTYK